MLGAEIHVDAWRPAADQQLVTARVADLIEACSDEWLEGSGPKGAWQDGALLAAFWDQAAVRLSDTTSYWRHHNPTATHIFKVAMTYTWGFKSLTWGDRKAKIDIDIRARPWNAARDFYEYLNDTETDHGPINPPSGTKPEQAKLMLSWNPASIPVTTSALDSKKSRVLVLSATTRPKQGFDRGTAMKDDEFNGAGPSLQVKPSTVYGSRDANMKIVAERVDIPEDVATGQRHKLIITFKNLSLKDNWKHEEGRPTFGTDSELFKV
ncbi:hypothetical protein N0V93_002724 [Gnomoniopsis smithogilvyi]|uniref:Uncharacterized protein n=1 Tax=Gnomoniopsis smithogilvyi TaxID=1191159 RepID=A0A9W8YVU1_9PEZI|nr:hypothetical protein N0V93_002724 [Gnomoniopsis smithogilvyi]